MSRTRAPVETILYIDSMAMSFESDFIIFLAQVSFYTYI